MSHELEQVATGEIEARLAKALAVHPQEPCRVGMLVGALREVLRLRGLLETKGKRRAAAKKDATAGPSERGLAFADWFRTTLAGDARLAGDWREQWARCFDEMLRLDGRTPEQIAAVCRWARGHDFWRGNFLTPLKLRQRKEGVMFFDRFAEAMKKAPGRGQRQSPGYALAPTAKRAVWSATE